MLKTQSNLLKFGKFWKFGKFGKFGKFEKFGKFGSDPGGMEGYICSIIVFSPFIDVAPLIII